MKITADSKIPSHQRSGFLTLVAFVLIALIQSVGTASFCSACPFCDAVGASFRAEIEIQDIAIFVKLVKRPDDIANPITSTTDVIPKTTFEIYHIIKGDKHVKVGEKIEAIYLGDAKPGAKFIAYAQTDPTIEYSTPIEITDNVESYIMELNKLPQDPGERMAKLQKYLSDSDSLVRYDVMSEFALADVKDMLKSKSKFNLQQIRDAIKSDKTPDHQLALNYTLLGICGDESDIPFLEERLTSSDDDKLKRLDALVGAYLMLKKEAGLELIEKKLLVPLLEKDAFLRYHQVLLALRYHADDGLFISKEKIVPLARHFLDYPKRADLVLLHLSRWKDWDSAKRIMELYRNTSEEDNPYLREPAINYMKACKLPEAKEYLAEMQKIDPAAYKRAQVFNTPLPKSITSDRDKKSPKKLDLTTKDDKSDQEKKSPAAEPTQSSSTR